jgi:general secretion pathway protein G
MFLRSVPRDPFFTGDPTTAPEDTWNVRAYGEPPDQTADSGGAVPDSVSVEPGKDVFDVSSKSDRVGINGIPYRQW